VVDSLGWLYFLTNSRWMLTRIPLGIHRFVGTGTARPFP